MIVPNSRQRITQHDLTFALEAVAQNARPPAEGGALQKRDLDIDELLDSRTLFDTLIQSRALLSVSPYFFYYVLVRQVFLDKGISERSVADYVSALLAHFMQGSRLRSDAESAPRSFVYLVDLIEAVRRARSHQAAFAMEARIGDVALFLTGVFPDAIYHRQTYGRRLPGIDYYEAVGRSGYRSAAQHPPARLAELGEVLAYMASEFRLVRRALNDLSDGYFCMTRGKGESVDRLLRQALYGTSEARDAGQGEAEEGTP
jgi:hypothetical protein